MQEELGKKFRFSQQRFDEWGPKATRILSRCLRQQQWKLSMSRIREPSTDTLTYNTQQIHSVFQNYYKTLYSHPGPANESVMKHYLTALDLPSLG